MSLFELPVACRFTVRNTEDGYVEVVDHVGALVLRVSAPIAAQMGLALQAVAACHEGKNK